MTENNLESLKTAVRDKAIWNFTDYYNICYNFLSFIDSTRPTRIVSPARQNNHYIFYQYNTEVSHRITRPLNTNLFIEPPADFKNAFESVMMFLADLKLNHENVNSRASSQSYLLTKPINKIVYTIQQSIGCIGDAFEDPNQTRKRIGQLFETLVKLLIQEVGLVCEPRTINIPIPINIASTSKTNHFLGYTVALNGLDGVYYVDPRPDMLVNERLREQISDFQTFLTKDLWVFSRSSR